MPRQKKNIGNTEFHFVAIFLEKLISAVKINVFVISEEIMEAGPVIITETALKKFAKTEKKHW